MKLFSTLVAAALLGSIAPSYGQVAFSEDFEGITVPALPADWENKTASAGGWKTYTGVLNFNVNNWSIPASSKYAVIDDYNNAAHINNPARLITPLIDVSALTMPVVTFKYYFVNAIANNGTQESFFIEGSVDSGKTWEVIDSITVGNGTAWQDGKVSLYDYIGEDSLMIAFSFLDKGGRFIGAAVDEIKVYEWDKPLHDAVLQSVTPDPALGILGNYGVINAPYQLGGVIYNNGPQPITSINVHYQIAGGLVVTDNITGLDIKGFGSGTFTATPYTMPSTLGEYKGKMWLELLSDTVASNDSGNIAVFAVAHKPQKKIFAEEGTGTWCGYCPRGHVFMDSIAKSPTHSASFSLVAVHNADPMMNPAYDAKIRSLVGGFPSMVIDRKQVLDPSALFDVYDAQYNHFGFADITLTEVAVPGFNYSLKATVKPAYELSGDYRLAVILTENDVKDPLGTGTGWDQVNYYSFQTLNIPLVGAGLNWQQEAARVPAAKVKYNEVARGIFPHADGAAGSLPNTMTPGNTYDYTIDIPMHPWWKRENMHAVVVLIRASDGHVLNSNNLKVSVGVSDVTAGVNELTIVPNPATNNAYINFSLTTASNVDVVITDMMGRTVQTISKENFGAGAHKLNVDLSGVTSGVYNVTVKTDNGSVSTRLSVVK